MQDVGRVQAAVIGHVPPVAQLQRPREAQQNRQRDGEAAGQPAFLSGIQGGQRGCKGERGGYGGIRGFGGVPWGGYGVP